MIKAVDLAKYFMKLREREPLPPDYKIGGLQEIFNHNFFLKASEDQRDDIMYKSSCAKYISEINYPWDNYFGYDLKPFLIRKIVLDLGCFNGGRGVAWYERYDLKKICGVDVDSIYIDSAIRFANKKEINAEYKVAYGENIPYEDNSFDAVLSFDVFEHVQSVPKTMEECWRILKPGGMLFVVFPSYYHPTEHHLSLVTQTPFFHYFFSSKTLIDAYIKIVNERGQKSYWYRRNNTPEFWERCNSINGTTLKKFKKYIDYQKWHIMQQSKKPIGCIGRNVTQKKWLPIFSNIFYPFTFIPGLQEILIQRITYILKKK